MAGKVKKILLAEDDQNLREVISEFLEAYGFVVSATGSGEEAFDLFNAESPDFVLADVLMPKLTGFQLCEKIRKSPGGAEVPIILMSALYKTAKTQKESREKYGLIEYLVKPINLKDAAAMIARTLGVTKEELMAAKRPVAAPEAFPPPAPPAARKAPHEKPESLQDAPDSGEASQWPPAIVLLSYFRTGRTGVATFTRNDISKKIFFRRGDVIYTTSTLASETFGCLLVDEGVITVEQLDWATREAKAKNAMLGKVMVNEGLIDNQTLSAYLSREVHARVLELLKWRKGTFLFEPDESIIQKINRPSMRILNDIYGMLDEGILDGVFFPRYEKNPHSVIMKSEERLALVGEVSWNPEDLSVLAHIDGESTIAEILERTDAQKERLFRLLGLLEFSNVFMLS
jgi:CheY-like chemotaxis protein